MIFVFIVGWLCGSITGYAIGAIMTMAKKDEEAADGENLQ